MGFFTKFILRTESVDLNNTFEMSKTDLHITFGVDANFAMGMGVCMTSIILNNKTQKINFHVFTDGIRNNDIDKLKQLTEYDNVKLKIYYIDISIFKNFPTTRAWSHATYYRFIMGEVLYGSADKVLYLDADILCIGSLDSIMDVDMKDSIILGIADDFNERQDRITQLGMKSDKYFNAGVMYININKWNEARVSERAVELLEEDPGRYKFLDQDILNLLLDGRTTFIGEIWNYLYDLGNRRDQLIEKVVLIHFIGDKPWQKWTEHHFMMRFYDEYKKKSPWAECPLVEPTHYKDKKRMARSYAKRKNYVKSLFWFAKYLISRNW